MSRNRRTVEIDGRTFEEEDLWDLMVTAFEGGSNYWIGTVNMSVETRKLHSLFASEFSNTITSWRWYHQVPFVLAGTSGYKGHELENGTLLLGNIILQLQNFSKALKLCTRKVLDIIKILLKKTGMQLQQMFSYNMLYLAR